jgi:hypothetical protein
MFRTIVLLASFIGASAFAPMGKVAMSSNLKMGFEDGKQACSSAPTQCLTECIKDTEHP